MKSFQVLIKTINNEPQEFPVPLYINCGQYYALGFQIQRVYDDSDCIVARKVVTFMYGKDLLGTQQFNTPAEFQAYEVAACQCCPPQFCYFTINSCQALVNGCGAVYKQNY